MVHSLGGLACALGVLPSEPIRAECACDAGLPAQATASSIGVNPIAAAYGPVKVNRAHLMLATYGVTSPTEAGSMTHAHTFNSKCAHLRWHPAGFPGLLAAQLHRLSMACLCACPGVRAGIVLGSRTSVGPTSNPAEHDQHLHVCRDQSKAGGDKALWLSSI